MCRDDQGEHEDADDQVAIKRRALSGPRVYSPRWPC